MTDQQYVLGIAYQAGRDPRIKKGADGARDYFTAEEVRKAASTFMKSLDSGIMHVDGTFGHVTITESFIWPDGAPDWDVDGTIVKSGDWLVGGILDDDAWAAVKAGRLTGWSPQGGGRRIRTES